MAIFTWNTYFKALQSTTEENIIWTPQNNRGGVSAPQHFQSPQVWEKDQDYY